MSAKKILALIGLMMAIAIVVLAYIVRKQTMESPVGGNFTLKDMNGKWNFSDHAKDLNLLYMGYVKCPDVCPLVLAHAADAFQNLSEEILKRTNFIFVSVDTEHDTAESVSTYATQFFPQFIGLTGTKDQVFEVSQLFNAASFIEKDPSSYLGYSVSHADRVYFLNKDGIALDKIQTPRSSAMLISKIKELL